MPLMISNTITLKLDALIRCNAIKVDLGELILYDTITVELKCTDIS